MARRGPFPRHQQAEGKPLKFVDRAKIWVKSGHGGAGCVSFRRERFIPKGGPDGGDGGRGGDVVIVAGDQRETLLRYRFNQHYAARNGRPGQGNNRTGESAEDLVLKVPAGTAILDAETGALIADLPRPGDSFTVCRGGRGGQGNARFASGGFRTPRFAQPGGDQEERRIVLELRLLADCALVGYPNVGKSSLVSRLSAATPKVADYPFTTLAPVLGTVRAGDSSYVMADLPGLIDGAADGLGLGHEFLRHVSRAGVLVHVLDPTRLDPSDPLKDYEAIRRELERYDSGMLRKPELLALGKADLPEAPEALKALRKACPDREVLHFSSVTRQGLDELRFAVWNEIKAMREKEASAKAAAERTREPSGARASGAAAEGELPRKISSRAEMLEAASRKIVAAGTRRPPSPVGAGPDATGPGIALADGPDSEGQPAASATSMKEPGATAPSAADPGEIAPGATAQGEIAPGEEDRGAAAEACGPAIAGNAGEAPEATGEASPEEKATDAKDAQGGSTASAAEEAKDADNRTEPVPTSASTAPRKPTKSIRAAQTAKAAKPGKAAPTAKAAKPVKQGKAGTAAKAVKPVRQGKADTAARAVKPVRQGKADAAAMAVKSGKPEMTASTANTRKPAKPAKPGKSEKEGRPEATGATEGGRPPKGA
ncbi:MAG: GTPase ObgE [Deltaproteobacteria bacterium]|jgi:GTP-binding protein|nr:GTPase ObgE [Deltaproteobacteria bacterium]